MKGLTFYYQKRRDGGIRTGVEFNQQCVLESFKSGNGTLDSALEWFVDLRFQGRGLPADPEAIRQWLLGKSDEIGAHLGQMADELQAGIDRDWPVASQALKTADGSELKIVASAVSRLTGREIGQVLLELTRNWRRLVQSLAPFRSEIAA